MYGRCFVLAAMALAVAGSTTALAAHHDGRIIRGSDDHGQIISPDTDAHGTTLVRVQSRPALRRVYLVDNAGHGHRTTLQVVNTPIDLDAHANYLRQGQYRIDDNHHLLRAQRLYRSYLARPARVIRNNTAAGDETSEVSIQPQLIIDKRLLPPRLERNKLGPVVLAD